MGQLFDTAASAVAPMTGAPLLTGFTGGSADLLGGVQGTLQGVGGFMGDVARGFTPQNNYNATGPLDIAALNNQLTTSQGNLAGLQGQQGELARALLAQSRGQGPNPAQIMLNQATDRNIAQNAGLIASQRGINPALAARLVSQNAGDMSQQAAGQGALMQAQQQNAAQGQLGGLYNQMAEQNLRNALMSGQLANQSSLGAQGINAGVSAQNIAATQATQSGLLSGIGGGMMAMLNKGGSVPSYAGGGQVSASQSIANELARAAGIPSWAHGISIEPMKMPSLGGMGGAGAAEAIPMAGGANAAELAGAAVMVAADGGSVPMIFDPVAKIYHADFQDKGTAQLKSKGGGVPGKPKVPGDSPVNDTVKARLSPGEVVIPNSVMQSDDPVKNAAKFVAEELKKNGRYSDDMHGDFKSALKAAISSRRAA